MIRFKAHSDGKVLIPDEAVELETGREYTVVVLDNGRDEEKRKPRREASTTPDEEAPVDAFEYIASIATDLGPPDLSERYEEYRRRKLIHE